MNNIFLIGDSTCQYNDETTFPQVGWGQFLDLYINDKYKVVNLAKNGRSTRSFINEGLIDGVTNNIKKGDYLIIQFGHNDEKSDERHTDPFDTYQKNLLFFINIARRAKAIPILLTPIYRRKFNNGILEENNHKEYPKAMIDLAIKEHVIIVDLCTLTKNELIKVGDIESKKYYMNFEKDIYPNYKDGKEDNTHLRKEGALMVLHYLIDELKKYNEIKFLK